MIRVIWGSLALRFKGEDDGRGACVKTKAIYSRFVDLTIYDRTGTVFASIGAWEAQGETDDDFDGSPVVRLEVDGALLPESYLVGRVVKSPKDGGEIRIRLLKVRGR